jgi:hypothetical protein
MPNNRAKIEVLKNVFEDMAAVRRSRESAGPLPIEWPDPDMTITQGARIVPPKLDVSLFGPLASILRTIAQHKGAPFDSAALALLVSASALVGVKRRVRPWSGWCEPTMLWGGLVAPPSQNKTPVLAPFREAIEAAEAYLSRDFNEKHRKWETECKAAEVLREKWEKDVKEAVNKGWLPPILPATAEAPPEPLKPRLWVGDITTEKAAELLANGPAVFSSIVMSFQAGLRAWGVTLEEAALIGRSGLKPITATGSDMTAKPPAKSMSLIALHRCLAASSPIA